MVDYLPDVDDLVSGDGARLHACGGSDFRGALGGGILGAAAAVPVLAFPDFRWLAVLFGRSTD